MPLQVVQSPSGAERLRRASGFVRAFPSSTELLIVGASREAVNDFVRALSGGAWLKPGTTSDARLTPGTTSDARSVDARATFGLHRFTLTQFAARLAAVELAARGLAPATPLGTEAVAARATFDAVRAGALRYFTPVARCPGFARALASTLTELRLAGATPDALAPLGGPGADLAILLRNYEAQLDAARISDRAALVRLAARLVRGRSWVARPTLLLDVPIRSAAERDLVAAMLERGPEALATVPAGDDQTLDALRGLMATMPLAHAPAADGSLSRLQTFLFSPDRPPERERDDEVSVFSAPGEGRECVEIARLILAETRGGTPFDQVAVLIRSPETYGALLENALRRASVPAWFSRGTRRPDPAGRAFLALLACAAEGLSARRFAEYLSLGQVPRLDISGAPPEGRAVWSGADDEVLGAAGDAAREAADVEEALREEPEPIDMSDDEPVIAGTLRAPWKWEALLVDASVVGGGRERWARRLAGLQAELTVQRDEIARDEPDSPRLNAIDRDLTNLQHLRRFALPVIGRMAAWPPSATWGEWLAAFETLAPMVLRQPERVLTVLAELGPMGAIGPITLDEAREVLTERLATLGYEPPLQRYGRVFVGTPEQARGRSFAVVFVPGLAERMFPQKLREDPMLLDQFRERLGVALSTQRHRLAGERLMLRLAAGAAERRLYFSYSRLELAEGRPRVPSLYALDVARATTGHIPDHEQVEREAERFAQARLAWPAPEDAAASIDDMEHDLAVLGPLLRRRDRGDGKGRARYLLELNPSLARSLRARWSRWRPGKWTAADGLVRATDALQPVLAAHRLTAKAYSVSSLQRFAVCPYQFLLSAIHRLEPRKEIAPIEQLDPLTRGSLFHAAQAAALRALEQAGALPVTRGSLDAAIATLDRVFDAVAERYRDDLVPAIQRVWQDELDVMRADLHAWLHRVVELDELDGVGWDPIRFEYGFGLAIDDSFDPRSRAEPVRLAGRFLLHGRIDLIERRRRGTRLRVTDHKTGADRTKEGMVIGGGETLQPVLYGLAVEAACGEADLVERARLFFCTTAGRFNQRVVAMDAHARHRGVEVLQIVDRAIERACFPPAPRERACAYCDFHAACGPHEEERMRKKDATLIADLLALREYP